MIRIPAFRVKFEAQLDLSSVKGVSALSKDVHFHLLSHCNIGTRRCDPSEDRLAERVERSARSVRSALKQLEDLGIISIRRNKGKQGTNQYILNLLERKILEHQPEENRAVVRQKPSAKKGKEKNKEKGMPHDRTQKPIVGLEAWEGHPEPFSFVVVKDPVRLEEWEGAIGDLNLGLPRKRMEMLWDGTGYRLPSHQFRRDDGSRDHLRKFMMRVIGSNGACFD